MIEVQDHDEFQIRAAIANWALWRDAGDWERFEQLWSPDGRMTATFFDGLACDFIAAARRSRSAPSVLVQHVMGGSIVRILGDRAVSESRMTIHMRAPVDGEFYDIACIGRFLDRWTFSDDRWLLLRRRPVYEKDRLDPLTPGARVRMDETLLASFPEGYRYTGYAQTRLGLSVSRTLPATGGASIESERAEDEAWLQDGAPRVERGIAVIDGAR